ncbi:DNA-binding protein [Parabacteroides sp. OttesenSCG-928-G21]|nr:DNA-binding protein [Parabacteroides sp. OttesenSCG-928-G21]
MSANYKLARMPKRKGDLETRPYHVRFASNGTIHTKEFMTVARDHSSFTEGDIRGVLQLVQDMMTDYLMMGYNVEVEGIGTFSISLRAPLVTNKRKMRSEQVSFRTVLYRPSAALRERLRPMPVYRAEEVKKSEFTWEECQKRLEEYLAKEPFITGSEYMRLNHCGRTKASNDLRRLKKEGMLERIGNGPVTHYVKRSPDNQFGEGGVKISYGRK